MSREKENIEKLINEKEFQFRDFNITGIETRAKDDGTEGMIISGVACVFNEETVLYKDSTWELREIVEPTALNGADLTDVIFNINHGGRVFARTRNKSLNLKIENDGLHMTCELWNDDEGHAQLYRDISRGNLDKMSFAFRIKKLERTYIENIGMPDVTLRTIKEIEKVFDVSVVDIPAYNTTEISARQVCELEKELLESERQTRKTESLELEKLKLKLKFKGEL